MSSSELELIHAAVAAGHPWARTTLDSLHAQEAADALLVEERELEQAASRNKFNMIGDLLDEAEAATDILAQDPLLVNAEASMEVVTEDAEVEDNPVTDVPHPMELDLDGADVINNNTSAGKDVDAKSTKRTYKRVNDSYQSFLSLIAAHAEKGGSKQCRSVPSRTKA